MPVTGTNHGLTVLTQADSDPNADTTDNLRLRRPVMEKVYNRFNDATSGAAYGHASGHEGIDFFCGGGTPVQALYGGVVVKIQDRDLAPYGQFVTLHSGTDPAANSGFLHT